MGIKANMKEIEKTMIKSSFKYILIELKHHIPFTVISTIVALFIFGVISRVFLQGP
ncbi:MAG: hypothetical protein LR001_10860 [Clostridiales bacterium]|nr:hypothetical protein [Clostridiales bacterium]